MSKELWKGNEAIAEAAIRAKVQCYFGYPITPQSEIPEYMAKHLPKRGGVFVQSESEIAAINMVYGAAGAGARVMTSSSSPGMSLKQEGISYIAAAQLPCVIVSIMRGGPGLGTIQPAQSDYFQATRGGGNGDYRTIVLAPNSIQEAVDMTIEAFDLADMYRIPVMVLADGMIGQMMEPVSWPEIPDKPLPEKEWATNGTKNKRDHNIVTSLFIEAKESEKHNLILEEKHQRITRDIQRYELVNTEDAEVVFVAYGTVARIAQAAIKQLEKEGIKAGLFRPVSIWPFPYDALTEVISQDSVKEVVCLELSLGQLLDDVKIGVQGKKPIKFLGKVGGVIMTPDEIVETVKGDQYV
ncbi:MAG TPA: 3-methyl-2-oxobutanoate dehydrogenase subunit VorB [Erysipelothrix sp.]|jgi:2-oxoglutarate ferredoxin oxidoreductase subunit alpha|nr:3-methyl-2-oxobutanoate dehydrogenase subunit VorB [Erysipelothrix sp.]